MPSIDSLSIQITASTSSANTKVLALTESLQGLVKAIDAIDVSKFETLEKVINGLGQGLVSLKGAGVKQIEKVGKALDSVNESAKNDTLDAVAKDVKKVSNNSKEASENIDKVSNTLNSGFNANATDEMAKSMERVSETVQKTASQMGVFKSTLAKLKIIIPTEGLEKVDKRIEQLQERIDDLKDRMDFKSAHVEGYVDGKDIEKDKEKIDGLIVELERLKLKKQELESHGGFKLNLGATISNLSKGFEAVNKKLDGFISKMRKAKAHTRETAKSTENFSLASMRLAKELTRVTKMLKLMITRMVLRKVIQNAIDGFKNLVQYSSEVDASVSLMWNSFRQLGNSVAAAVGPLINALAPALNYIIQLCIKVANAINQVISALTGRSTWTRAKTLTDDYAKSLDKSNKSAKDLKRTILGFDEINKLDDNKDSGGGMTKPEDMFEDAKIEAKWADMAKKLKSILNQLLAPIKKAWANIGDQVANAWKRAFSSVKKLLEDIGRDFMKVWNQPKTVKMLENILRIFRDIGSIVALLAEGLDKAWNKNKTGLKILEGIRDIFAVVIQHVKNMTSATVLWAKELDFSPLLNAFKDWVISMEPVVDAISGAFEDFYRKVLLPLGKWSIEDGLPQLIEVFRRFNDEVEWDTIRERLNRVWEALKPFAEAVGEGLVKFIGGVSDKIAGFLNSKGWDSFIDTLVKWTNSIDADAVARGLEKIFEALVAYKTVDTLVTIVDKLKEVVKISGSGITVGIKFAIGFAVAQGLFNLALKFWQWCYKIGMEEGGYTKLQIDVEMAWFNKFRDEYGGVGGMGHLIMDWLTGDTDKKKAQWEVEAKVETLGISEAEVQVEDLRKKTEDLGNSNGIQMFVEKANGSVEQLKNLDTISFDNTQKSVENIGKSVGDLAISVEKDTDSIQKSADSIKFTPASTDAAKFKKEVGGALDELAISVEKDADSIKKSTEGISFAPLSDAALDLQTNVSEAFGGVDETVENTNGVVTDNFNKISQTISNGSNDIIEATDTIKTAFSEDKWTFDGVAKGLGETFRRAKEAIKKEWNEIADKLNGSHQVASGTMKINLPRFATGGFPDDDSLFMANSTEMLGKFSNGQNVVANNQQITDGIAQAVYSAIMSANGSGGATKYINNTIQIDGRAIARAVTMGQDDMNRRFSPVTV